MSSQPCKSQAVSQFSLSKSILNNLNKFDLSPASKLVLLYLIDCYNPKKDTVYPKQATVAERLGLGIATVKRAVRELSLNGLILVENNNKNSYRLTSKIFEQNNLILSTAQNDTKQSIKMIPPCIEHKKEHKKNKNHSIETLNDSKMNEILNLLRGFRVFDAERLINQYGLERVQEAVKVVENAKPASKGAYLRKVLLNDLEAPKKEKERKYHHNTEMTGIPVPKYVQPAPVKCASPLDFSREEALEWLETLPPFLHKSYFANEVRKKWII